MYVFEQKNKNKENATSENFFLTMSIYKARNESVILNWKTKMCIWEIFKLENKNAHLRIFFNNEYIYKARNESAILNWKTKMCIFFIPTFKCCKITKLIQENNVQTNWKRKKVKIGPISKTVVKKNSNVVVESNRKSTSTGVKHSTTLHSLQAGSDERGRLLLFYAIRNMGNNSSSCFIESFTFHLNKTQITLLVHVWK